MTREKPDLREFSIDVVRRLRRAGHVAYWAGGCVRDILLQRIPKDFDVATSARPEEVQRLFKRSIAVGVAFGVINVLGPGGAHVEVATFRSDGQYTDGRHPDSVSFSTPEEDAKRRDFTINGMFYDPLAESEDQTLLDFVGGREDMKRRVIRAIGDPRQRFAEDKLRMLRAVRFAALFGYTIDPPTTRAIADMAGQIDVVSPERILAELRLMLEDPTRRAALEWLQETTLFSKTLPELEDIVHCADAWRQTLAILDSWPRRVPLAQAVAGLAATIDEATAIRATGNLLHRLRSANDDREPAIWLLEHRRAFEHARTLPASRIKRLLAHPWRNRLLDLVEATERTTTGGSPNAEYVRSLLEQWTAHDIDPAPLITGDDLVRLGYKPGPLFKEILDGVRDRQLNLELVDVDSAIAWLKFRWPP